MRFIKRKLPQTRLYRITCSAQELKIFLKYSTVLQHFTQLDLTLRQGQLYNKQSKHSAITGSKGNIPDTNRNIEGIFKCHLHDNKLEWWMT